MRKAVSCTRTTLMREEKKNIERNQFERFKNCYSHFPDGTVNHKDRPDFRVHTKNGIYGIEHTRVFRPKSKQGIVLQEQESLKEETVEKAKALYHKSGDHPNLIVDVFFRSHYGLKFKNYDTKLTKQKVDGLANSISKFVINNIPDPGSRIVLPRMNPRTYKRLPKEIKQIAIQRDFKSNNEIWDPSLGGFVPELTPDLIQKSISKKQGDVKKFEVDCLQNWLLIVEAGTKPSKSFDSEKDNFINQTYSTDFDKVFLFRMLDRKVYDLNIQKRSYS